MCTPSPLEESAGKGAEGVLIKEACYRAIGLGRWDLMDFIDFRAWLQGPLGTEVTTADSPEHKIVARRAAWLIGEWATQISPDLRKPVYTLLIRLIAHSDVVVQLTAVNSLCNRTPLSLSPRLMETDPHFFFDSCQRRGLQRRAILRTFGCVLLLNFSAPTQIGGD